MDATDYTNEIWKTIPFAPDYKASSLGRIKRHTPTKRCRAKILKTDSPDKDGYKKVKLFADKKPIHTKVHTCVCAAFNGHKPSPKHQVAHADGDISNNRAENLRWATSKENGADKRAHGTLKGERNPSAKLTKAQIYWLRTLNQRGVSRKELMSIYSISPSHIGRILRGESWVALP